MLLTSLHVDFFQVAIDFFLNFDAHFAQAVQTYGFWIYGILFGITFLETGAVIMPLLPGDSLLFAAGAIATGGRLNILVLFILLASAAILGNTVNYLIGRYFGQHIVRWSNGRWIKQRHLDRTHQYFERYGGLTVFLSRFLPIIRTIAPFVAGLGKMSHQKFLFYNVVGGVSWAGLFLFAGYFFGNLPLVKKNFELIILAIVVISFVPIFLEGWRRSQNSKHSH